MRKHKNGMAQDGDNSPRSTQQNADENQQPVSTEQELESPPSQREPSGSLPTSSESSDSVASLSAEGLSATVLSFAVDLASDVSDECVTLAHFLVDYLATQGVYTGIGTAIGQVGRVIEAFRDLVESNDIQPVTSAVSDAEQVMKFLCYEFCLEVRSAQDVDGDGDEILQPVRDEWGVWRKELDSVPEEDKAQVLDGLEQGWADYKEMRHVVTAARMVAAIRLLQTVSTLTKQLADVEMWENEAPYVAQLERLEEALSQARTARLRPLHQQHLARLAEETSRVHVEV